MNQDGERFRWRPLLFLFKKIFFPELEDEKSPKFFAVVEFLGVMFREDLLYVGGFEKTFLGETRFVEIF